MRVMYPQQPGWNGPPPGTYAPQPPQPPQPPPKVSSGCAPVVAIAVVCVIGLGSVAYLNSIFHWIDGRLSVPGLSVGNGPRVLTDESLTIGARSSQGACFSGPSSEVQIRVDGRKHADKGFSVAVMRESDVPSFQKGGTSVDVLRAFDADHVHAFDQTGTVPAGAWCAVVQNSENLVNTMTVQVRVVANP